MVSFERLAALQRLGTRGVVVTVVDARGSTPRKAGARMVVLADGKVEGTVGGGAVEKQAMELARQVMQASAPRFMEVQLGQDLGMCCGGSMRLYLEPLTTTPPFILIGGGHIAKATAHVLAGLGFALHVADERDGFAVSERFPTAVSHVSGVDNQDLDRLPFGPDAYVLVATHDHALDQTAVERCLRRPFTWLGLVASRRKALKTREHLLHKGFTLTEIGRMRSPVGLDLGGQSPEEIAVSLVAEVIHVRHRGTAPTQVASLALDLGQPQPTDVVNPGEAAATLPGGSP